MKLLQVDTIDEAIDKLLHAAGTVLLRTEWLPLSAAPGRVLVEDVVSSEDIPGFDRSTVDGYAVKAADTTGAGESLPTFLRLVDSVEMGKPAAGVINSGDCAYVPTGGMLPPGADAVVMVEHCEQFGETVAIGDAVSPGRNVIYRGEDIPKGSIALSRGRRLGPADCGALAAMGYDRVPVVIRPKMAIFSSGDEVVPPAAKPTAGQVRDINSYALAAQAQRVGFDVGFTGILPDDRDRLGDALAAAMTGHDIVIISGGSSQGQKDMTGSIIDSIARPGVLTHGLAMKPGKPTIIGYDAASQSILLGLPGHPVSAMMVFDSVLAAWWRRLTREKPALAVPAVLNGNLAGAPGRETYQPVRLQAEGGVLSATPLFFKSGLITALTAADGYIVIDKDREGLRSGEPVQVHFF